MRIPIITSLLERRGRSRLRSIMRGYRFLKASQSLSQLADISRALTLQNLAISRGSFSQHLFGAGIDKAELICRQYLMLRVAGLNLNRALLYSLGKLGSPVIYYLPPEWRKIIRAYGFTIASFRTTVLWNAFIGMMLAYGVLIICRIILDGVIAVLTNSAQSLGNYVYFHGLARGNLPQPCRDGRSHDIISWYLQWAGRDSTIDTICHDVTGAEQRVANGITVASVPKPILPFADFNSLGRFIVWSLWAILLATRDFFLGRWWHPLLLNQAALAAQVRMQKIDLLAKDYLFHNSTWFYRPLWTYDAENQGSRILFYFYSTNCESFKRNDAYPQIPYGWELMNWPHYLVWDEYQADFVRRAVGEQADINLVGPIWFHSSAEEMPEFCGEGVAVFDVTPFRSSRYRTLGIDFEYYLPNTSIQFLDDIQKVTEAAGFTMIWKRKRKIGLAAHPRYRFFAERVSDCANVTTLNPDISAFRVIEASSAVISMPYTSTALIARELGKPSCYYDPTKMLQKDDRAAHGINIINCPEELMNWLTLYCCTLSSAKR